ncbi:MAG TPA: NADP-dependent oxidoreductase [Actinomycetota bacterium]|nr:NADP-dependent oxidoreductase [Actinomycetota bacterium]
MRAFAIDEFGQPGSLRDLPVPEPGEGQVRILVAAAGLNPFDNAVVQGYLKDRMEHRFPLVPGMDASGTVEAVGEGIEAWRVGDEVFGSVGKMYLGEGTLAEFAAMSAGTVARKPASVDHRAAAAIPVAGVTALLMADALHLSEGDVVVAIGASGGVGSYFVQLASERGARVVAVCRGENADYARRLGAAEVIDYTVSDVAEAARTRYPDGIDAIADMRGDREGMARLAEHVRSGGRVASAVGAADAEALGGRGIEATNVMGTVDTAWLDRLTEMLVRGAVTSPEIRSFALADAGEALGAVGTGHVRGKIVVTPA